MSTRLAVVVSHPIQYYAPWFAELHRTPGLALMVFHLWDFGVEMRLDRGFGQPLQWDLPLLEGYPSCLVPNRSRDPGTHHPGGLDNPQLVSRILSWRPDAILLFGYSYLSHLRLLLDPRLLRVPILLRGDSHDLARSSSLRSSLAGMVRRLLFRRFAGALAVGQANAAYLRASGLAPARIHLAPHAVDNARFQADAEQVAQQALLRRSALGIAAQAPVVLFCGKFEPKKRPLDLLEAFLALNHPEAVLLYVGAGPLDDQLRARVSQAPAGRVHLLGFINQAAMPALYAMAELLVLPSVGNGETWGLCVNEAMNLACAVIVSSHVGCGPDLVLPGRTGWIVPAGDQRALQACLAEAIADPVHLRAMGRAAREHIQGFSYAHATAGLLRALAQIRATAPAPSSAPCIDLLVPELYAREGGIQIYSRSLIEALLAVLPQPMRLRVFVRNDRPEQLPPCSDPRLELHACGHSAPLVASLRLMHRSLSALIRQRPMLSISTHVRLAPLQVLLARLAGCPALCSAHGIDVWELRPGLRRWALDHLDQLLPVSRCTHDQLQRQLGSTCPAQTLLPNTYDDSRFRPGLRPAHLLRRYGLQPEQPLIFCLTRLSIQDRYKGVRALIEALPPLLIHWPDLRLLIGGCGDDLLPLRAEVAAAGLDQQVLLPGLIPQAELADHFRLASVFALPSEREGFGIVFLEAAGCGCPVLAGNRDGSVDALLQGRLGCLVDPRQPLAPALQALLEGKGEPLWHQPEALADAVRRAFGRDAFQQRLKDLLAQAGVI